ncbi:PIR Superfamily Protein [Plasmodium ovale wallikeri]|uniref:PIR Superfamily Protein n=1 Tax=Plasmodium ovale wallikeri TaxID=864142 RepID=A0A1A9AFF6_PLAOA|nr:PIR Superfamily Protein [Plasmodium ovale wallikeri]SBT58161.1 PIR Superfamily Protein [Plasmodium ovale wallikeri]
MPPEIQTIYNVASSYSEYKQKLDSYKGSEEYRSYLGNCNEYTQKYLTGSQGNASTICHAVMYFLNHLKEHSDSSYIDKGCKYLFYWLYADVLNKEQSTENTLILYKELYDRYNSDEDSMNILDNHIKQINEVVSDNLVKLFGIYDIFKKLKEEFISQDNENKCTNDCVELYTRYVSECRKVYDNDFCNELKNFREVYNSYIQSIPSCKEEQYLLPPIEAFDMVSIILTPFLFILVTTLIFPILYKFTAFGPWLHRKFGKQKNIWDNINEETNCLIHSYNMENKNYQERNYNIAYNSSRNS